MAACFGPFICSMHISSLRVHSNLALLTDPRPQSKANVSGYALFKP